MNVTTRLSVILGTGFGTGLSPVASGTVGTLLGLPLVYIASQYVEYTFSLPVIAYCILLSLIAIPICQGAENHFKKKDDGRIVADEYLTFPICMIGLPLDPVWFLIAFLSNRFFDITKIPPAYQAQRIQGGLGIVVDDVIAAIYSLGFNHLLFWAWRTWG